VQVFLSKLKDNEGDANSNALCLLPDVGGNILTRYFSLAKEFINTKVCR
jgi:hypothetical protein